VLDGIRGLAVLQVVLGHTHYMLTSDPFGVTISRWSIVNRITQPGDLGLDIFFTLSGFLITSLLLRDYECRPSTAESAGSVFRRFYARRALRLLPALYVMLALDWLLVLWEGFDIHRQWRTTYSAVLYIANWASVWNVQETNGDLGHLWSLAVEEQFYIVWPLALFAIWSLRRRPWLQLGIIALAIAVIAQHRTTAYVNGLSWLHAYIRTDMRIDSMLVGAFFAILFRYIKVDRTLAWVAGTIGLAVICWYKFLAPLEGMFGYTPRDMYRFGFTRNAIMVGLCILAAMSSSWWINSVLSLKPLVVLGKYSYGLYLYHHIVFHAVMRHLAAHSQSFRLAVGYGLSALLTFLSWKLVEKPCLTLKKRFESPRSSV